MELGEAYEVLGLLPGADETLVRAAYRAQAKRDHLDYGGSQQAFIGSEQAFRCIERAGFPAAGQCGWKRAAIRGRRAKRACPTSQFGASRLEHCVEVVERKRQLHYRGLVASRSVQRDVRVGGP